MKLSLDQKLRLGFASMLLVLFSASLLSYLSKNNLVDNNQWINHTQNVLLKIQALQSNLADSKIAQLNYIVGGDKQWLEKYDQLHQQSRRTIYQIGQFTVDNPKQQTRLTSLLILFDQNYRSLAQSIGLKRAQMDDKALKASQSAQELVEAAKIQAIIDEMRLEEEQLLRLRTAQATQSAFSSSVFITLAFILTCLMVVLFIFQYNKDIRIKKEAASKLEAKEKMIMAINNASPDIMYVFDLLEQRNVYVNKEMSTILGYDAAETDSMGGEILTELLHPEDMLTVINKRKSVLRDAEQEVYDMEYRMRHRDGHYRWLHSREVVFARDEHQRPSQMLGIA
ncbi:MAG: CHASE3 domain-containing protein, partial [Bacteroidota bacterium]